MINEENRKVAAPGRNARGTQAAVRIMDAFKKEIDYGALAEQIRALTAGVPYPVANMANVSALLFQSLPKASWAGFYLLEDGCLILGPFQGKPACIRIPLGKGVCGTAAAEDRTVLVPDVHAFPGHIACDPDSRSEVVIPIRKNGRVTGVLDIDSRELSAFTKEDADGLERCVRAMEEKIF